MQQDRGSHLHVFGACMASVGYTRRQLSYGVLDHITGRTELVKTSSPYRYCRSIRHKLCRKASVHAGGRIAHPPPPHPQKAPQIEERKQPAPTNNEHHEHQPGFGRNDGEHHQYQTGETEHHEHQPGLGRNQSTTGSGQGVEVLWGKVFCLWGFAIFVAHS